MKQATKIILVPIIIFALTTALSAQTYTSLNYALSGARIVASGGNAASGAYTLDNVVIGNFVGGKSESGVYSLRAGFIISVAGTPSIRIGLLEPIGWQIGEPVRAGRSYLARALVTNIGDVKVGISLSVEDKTLHVEGWKAGTEPDANGVNTYLMNAVITGRDTAMVDETYFNENGNEDMASELAKRADADTFACSRSSRNGINIMPDETRYLYLKFNAPHADTTGGTQHEAHSIYIEVKANQ